MWLFPLRVGHFIFMTTTDTKATAEVIAPYAVDAVLFKEEDIVEGFVVAIEKAALYVDLGASGTGIIYGI